MTNPIVRYIEREYKRGFSLPQIRTSLVAAGHSLEHVEETIDHMFKRRMHHHLILMATLAVIIGGMVLLHGTLSVDTPGTDVVLEQPMVLSEDYIEYRQAWASVPTPLDKETCYGYALELERIVCLEKYGRITVPWMEQLEPDSGRTDAT